MDYVSENDWSLINPWLISTIKKLLQKMNPQILEYDVRQITLLIEETSFSKGLFDLQFMNVICAFFLYFNAGIPSK